MSLASLRAVSKRFGATVAVDGVDLEIEVGLVLAVVGENGAGKSTLLRMVAGMLAPDSGSISVEGRPLPPDPARAIAAGVGMVHQHFMLVDSLTVLENVVLGCELVRGPFLDLSRARHRLEQLSRDSGLEIDPDRLIEDLSVGEKQRVEILKVLYRGARLLILDEPTALLTPSESRHLIEMARAFAARRTPSGEGNGVVIITHKLDEVMQVADRIVVLRQGRKVLAAARGRTSAVELADAMVGRHVELPRRSSSAAQDAAPPGPVLLEVRGLSVARASGAPSLEHVSLKVRAGEILGIAGVEGNGQAELIAALAGLQAPHAGSIWLEGRDITLAHVAERQRLGLAVVHEDRQRRGLVLDLSVADNFALGRTREWSRWGLFDRGALCMGALREMRRFDIRASGPGELVRALSGGNQQKIVLAREIGRHHLALVAAQPTRGVDVGAIEVIYRELLTERAAGKAILLVSADLAELLSLCDRIAVLYRGRIVGEVPAEEATEERVGRWMMGVGESKSEGARA